MVQSIRLTDTEQAQLREKAVEINKILINLHCEPLKDSALAHKVLEMALEYVEIAPSGELVLTLR